MAKRRIKPPLGLDFKDEDLTRDGRPKRRKKPAAADAPQNAAPAEAAPAAPSPAPRTPVRTTAGRRRRKKQEEHDRRVEMELAYLEELDERDREFARVVSVVVFAVGLFITAVILFRGSEGWRSFHEFMMGTFGVTALSVPATIICSAFLIGKCKPDRAKLIWLMVFGIIILSSAVQIFFVGNVPGDSLKENLKYLSEDGKNLKGGGTISIILGGLLMKLLGTLGAGIVIMLLVFVVITLLTEKDLIELCECIGKPFYFLAQCIHGVHNVLMGGSFDEAFEDDEDDEYDDYYYDDEEEPEEEAPPEPTAFDKDLEAIEMVNSRDHDIDIPILTDSADIYAEPDTVSQREKDEFGLLFDIPIPDYVPPAPPEEAAAKAEETIDVYVNTGDNSEENDLDALINRAAKNGTKSNGSSSAEEEKPEPQLPLYILPGLELLTPPDGGANSVQVAAEMHEKADTIVNTLKSFGVEVKIKNIYRGPTITRYEIQPGAGVKVSKIRGLEDDIALSLAAQGVRLEAPVPGKAAVGIEVPNINKDTVTLREILSSNEFRNAQSKLAFAVGKDITGNAIIGDISKMPHVIIAGTTGSGKSVCTRSIIMSILYKAKPDEVKMILIDPKVVEFKVFEGIPHLLIPIVTEAKKAAGALNWAVNEMMRRYNTFADIGANDLRSYNEIAEEDEELPKMPQIVIFIDELADMMLVAGKEVEDSICRLAQMGRAAGMHLVVATQRPTTDVITGLIKANIPSRIALSVMSQVDSRTIIDMAGADKLLGNGDMLYMPIGTSKPVRIQGCFASSKDVSETLNFIRAQAKGEYDIQIVEAVDNFIPQTKGDHGGDSSVEAGSEQDYVLRGAEVAVNNGSVSTTMLQRKLKLGYAKAARIMDELEERGIIGPSEGSKPRKVLMSKMQFDDWKMRMLDEG